MVLVTYYREDELEKWTSVKDKDLDELLQEVREKFDNRYFLQEHYKIKKRWCRKPVERTYYTLLYHNWAHDTQVISFNYEGEEINFFQRYPKAHVHTALCNLLNGYDKGYEVGKNEKV